MQDAGCRMRDAGCRMRDAGCGMRDAGCGMQDAGCRMRDAGCGMRDAGCRMQDAGCRMQDAGCGMRNAGCGMQDAGCRMSEGSILRKRPQVERSDTVAATQRCERKPRRKDASESRDASSLVVRHSLRPSLSCYLTDLLKDRFPESINMNFFRG